MAEFPKNYNFSETEKKWQSSWLEQKVYKWNENESRENSFVVDTPPPTVSGELHIGHVYSYTQTDFIVRFQRMKGKNIFYPIGFDDNGLPTERLVEKQKGVKASSMDRAQFIDICLEVVKVEEEKFRNLFRQIGLSVDWDLEYQTISPLSRTISQMSFLDLVQKGKIYRDNQPILWDPVDQTALAQADIEDKEKKSCLNEIIFTTDGGEQLKIVTTRPEMLPACVAVFFHPDDSRYKHLQNQYAITPLFKDKVPILSDEIVQPNKGSGLVMCCTFGDQTDMLWWKKYKLPTKIIINKQGKICYEGQTDHGKEFATQLYGLKINDARNKIIELLKETGALLKQTEIIHMVKCAERSGAPLEILTVPQWFVHTIEHKDIMLKRTQELNWHPKHMKIRLENWINSLAWDWCISRQRFFGVPFPVWYSKKSGEKGKPLFADASQLPVDPLKDLPLGYSREEVEPDYDVMDTWATSSVSPQLSTYGISENFAIDLNRHQKLFPVDLRPQAHEILRTWAFYTLLKAHLHQNTLPWKDIMISGWCLAEDRSKMSKSKGNIISPITLLQQYGADVIRYWSSTSKLGSDTAYSEDVMKNGKRLINKIWNAAKFASIHFDQLEEADKKAEIPDLKDKICREFDQWIINKLIEVTSKAEEELANYEYATSMYLVENFFWYVFCDNYLEITKVRTYNENGLDKEGQYSAILTIYHCLETLLKLFAPFLPYITEEIYQNLYSKNAMSIHSQGNWPQWNGFKFNTESIKPENLIEILNLVRKSKADRNLSIKAPIQILEIEGVTLSDKLITDLENVTCAQKVSFVREFLPKGHKLEGDNIHINIIYNTNSEN